MKTPVSSYLAKDLKKGFLRVEKDLLVEKTEVAIISYYAQFAGATLQLAKQRQNDAADETAEDEEKAIAKLNKKEEEQQEQQAKDGAEQQAKGPLEEQNESNMEVEQDQQDEVRQAKDGEQQVIKVVKSSLKRKREDEPKNEAKRVKVTFSKQVTSHDYPHQADHQAATQIQDAWRGYLKCLRLKARAKVIKRKHHRGFVFEADPDVLSRVLKNKKQSCYTTI